tara:strand:+ start:2467 stop:2934 length:468 start_codon:yes stop_codon:yes gene_type:complete
MIKYLVFLFIFIISCGSNKVVNVHGISQIDIKSDKLQEKKSNTNDILEILGPPSVKSAFNDNVWIYIERKETRKSVFKLGKKKLIKNNVLVVSIDDKGILNKKNLFDLNNMNDLEFSENITTSGYSKNSYVYSLLRSLRDKINSPIKRQQREKRK